MTIQVGQQRVSRISATLFQRAGAQLLQILGAGSTAMPLPEGPKCLATCAFVKTQYVTDRWTGRETGGGQKWQAKIALSSFRGATEMIY